MIVSNWRKFSLGQQLKTKVIFWKQWNDFETMRMYIEYIHQHAVKYVNNANNAKFFQLTNLCIIQNNTLWTTQIIQNHINKCRIQNNTVWNKWIIQIHKCRIQNKAAARFPIDCLLLPVVYVSSPVIPRFLRATIDSQTKSGNLPSCDLKQAQKEERRAITYFEIWNKCNQCHQQSESFMMTHKGQCFNLKQLQPV